MPPAARGIPVCSRKLHHGPVGSLQPHDGFHVLRGQRLKIQLVRNVEIRADRLRVIVDDDGLIPCPGKSPGGVNGAVVKLDALPDADGAGAQHQHFFAVFVTHGLVLAAKHGVIVGRGRRKLRRAGVHHLVYRLYAVVISHLPDLGLAPAGEPGDHLIGELQPLGLPQQFHRQLPLRMRLPWLLLRHRSLRLCLLRRPCPLQGLLHLHQHGNLINKPYVDLRDLMDRLIVDPFPQRLGDHKDPLVVHHGQALQQFFSGQRREIIAPQTVHMLLQGADSLHQRPLKIVADAHDLAGGFHLRGQRALRRDKLIKRKPRNLHHTVIQRWLKAGVGLACDGIFDLVQGIAQRDLGRHLGDGIPRGLGGQRGGAAHPGIDLDDTVLKAGGMQRELHVAAAGDL